MAELQWFRVSKPIKTTCLKLKKTVRCLKKADVCSVCGTDKPVFLHNKNTENRLSCISQGSGTDLIF